MLNAADHRSIRSIISSLLTLKVWHALRTHGIWQLGWIESRNSGVSVDKFGPPPWWPYSAVHYLDQVVPTDYSVLEFGGGSSTIWWLERGNEVTTIETDSAWVENLRKQVQAKGLQGKWHVEHVADINMVNVEKALPQKRFDVVINDGLGDRNAAVELLNKFVKDEGLAVWDNSDRAEYKDALTEFQGKKWKKLEFFGLGPINAYCSQTTVFSQVSHDPIGRIPKIAIIPN